MNDKTLEKQLIKQLKDSFPDLLTFNIQLSKLKTFWKEQGKKEALKDKRFYYSRY